MLLPLLLLLVTCCWKQLLLFDAIQSWQHVSEVLRGLQGLLLCCRLGVGSAEHSRDSLCLYPKPQPIVCCKCKNKLPVMWTLSVLCSAKAWQSLSTETLPSQAVTRQQMQGNLVGMSYVRCHTVSPHCFTHVNTCETFSAMCCKPIANSRQQSTMSTPRESRCKVVCRSCSAMQRGCRCKVEVCRSCCAMQRGCRCKVEVCCSCYAI